MNKRDLERKRQSRRAFQHRLSEKRLAAERRKREESIQLKISSLLDLLESQLITAGALGALSGVSEKGALFG